MKRLIELGRTNGMTPSEFDGPAVQRRRRSGRIVIRSVAALSSGNCTFFGPVSLNENAYALEYL